MKKIKTTDRMPTVKGLYWVEHSNGRKGICYWSDEYDRNEWNNVDVWVDEAPQPKEKSPKYDETGASIGNKEAIAMD